MTVQQSCNISLSSRVNEGGGLQSEAVPFVFCFYFKGLEAQGRLSERKYPLHDLKRHGFCIL